MKHYLPIAIAVIGLGLLPQLLFPDLARAVDKPSINVTYRIPPNISAQEQKWYKTFQEGNILVDGWVIVSQDILAKLPAAQQPEQQANLERLGDKIGREWAKDNEIRKIDTDMLKKWGKELKAASKKDSEALTLAINRISRQVDSILR